MVLLIIQENLSDKKSTILIVYTHGSYGDQTLDKCKKNGIKFLQ